MLTIHKVTDVIGGGELVARSHGVLIADGINAIEKHCITWPQMGPFLRRSVGAMLARVKPCRPAHRCRSRTGSCRVGLATKPVSAFRWLLDLGSGSGGG